jgi:hypothetical protein
MQIVCNIFEAFPRRPSGYCWLQTSNSPHKQQTWSRDVGLQWSRGSGQFSWTCFSAIYRARHTLANVPVTPCCRPPMTVVYAFVIFSSCVISTQTFSKEGFLTLPPASPSPATGRLYDQPANCCCIVCDSIGPSTYESVGASEVNSRSKLPVSRASVCIKVSYRPCNCSARSGYSPRSDGSLAHTSSATASSNLCLKRSDGP